MRSAKTRMRRLIWVFAGCTSFIVDFVVRWLIHVLTYYRRKNMPFITNVHPDQMAQTATFDQGSSTRVTKSDEPKRQNWNLRTCVPNEYSNQPALPRSLVWVFVVHETTKQKKWKQKKQRNFVALAFRKAPSENSHHTARMRRLIWISAGRTCPKARCVPFRLLSSCVFPAVSLC